MLWGNGHHIIVKDANNSGIFYKIKMLCSHVAIRKHNERMWSSSCVKSEHKIYEKVSKEGSNVPQTSIYLKIRCEWRLQKLLTPGYFSS